MSNIRNNEQGLVIKIIKHIFLQDYRKRSFQAGLEVEEEGADTTVYYIEMDTCTSYRNSYRRGRIL